MSKKPTSTKAKGAAKPPKADRSVGVGHNQLSDDQRAALLMQTCDKIEKEQKKSAEIVAGIRNLRKIAKADGISPEELNYALYLRKTDPAEAAALFRQHVQIAKWLSHPIGRQADIFDEDRTPLEDRALAEGKAAGLAGETAKPPYDAVAGQKWMEGWHMGQSVIAKGIKTKAEEEPGHQTLIKGEPPAADDDDVLWSGNAPATVN